MKPLKTYFPRHGLELIDVQRVPSKGGSIRCTLQKMGGSRTNSNNVDKLIELEDRLEISSINFFKPIISQIHDVLEEI